jgi:hypothetical protein
VIYQHPLWHLWRQRPGGWSPWHRLGSEARSEFWELAVGAHADGRLVVFATAYPPSGSSRQEQGESNALWQREQAVAGGWSPWRQFTRPAPYVLASPALALDANRRLHPWLRVPGSVDLYRLRQTERNNTEWDDCETARWFRDDPGRERWQRA